MLFACLFTGTVVWFVHSSQSKTMSLGFFVEEFAQMTFEELICPMPKCGCPVNEFQVGSDGCGPT